MSLAPLVVRAVQALAPALEAAVPQLVVWGELVEQWNRKIDLTAARTREELVDLLVADAALLATLLPEKASIVDVGTGAGAPGLGLALLRPDLQVTLVEPLQKRVSFLRTTVGTLDRADVKVVRSKGEDLATEGATFDVAMARATLPPPEWLALGSQLAPSGEVVVLLARGDAPSLPGRVLRLDTPYVWPLTGAERRVLVYANG
jgi:16S rRNA (guanine527-N7)-methyltransferase